jgi:hypothetical protein
MKAVYKEVARFDKKRAIVLVLFLALLVLSIGFIVGVEYAKNKCYNACIEWSCGNYDALGGLCSRMNPTVSIGNLTFNLSTGG